MKKSQVKLSMYVSLYLQFWGGGFFIDKKKKARKLHTYILAPLPRHHNLSTYARFGYYEKNIHKKAKRHWLYKKCHIKQYGIPKMNSAAMQCMPPFPNARKDDAATPKCPQNQRSDNAVPKM